MSKDQTIFGIPIKASPYNALPQMTIDSKIEFYFNNDTVQVISLTGGHTGCDLVVYFKLLIK